MQKEKPIKEIQDDQGKKFIRKGQKVEVPKTEEW